MKRGKSFVVLLALLVLFSMHLFAAGEAEESQEEMDMAAEMMVGTVGPAGNEPVGSDTISLSSDQKSSARARGLRAAILMHTSSDFSNSVILGARDVFDDVGVEVVLVADAEFDANKQKSDIENALILEPDIIMTLVLDPVSGAAALRPAIEQGVEIVLLSNLPQDFVHGVDYAAIVTDDLFAMGKSVAELINDRLGGSGKVGLLFHDANYYVTNQRDQSVESVLRKEYSGIEIVAKQGIVNPEDGEVVASAIITQHPDVEAIYAPWDTIAEGVVAAARAANRADIAVFTMDLGENNVLDLVKGGNIAGIVADLPYELGATMAEIGVLGVLGEATPPFVTVPAIKVTKANVRQKWEESLRRPLPQEIEAALR